MSIDLSRRAKRSAIAIRVTGLVVAGTLLAFLLGLLGRQSWVLDLFSHFRIQYAFVLAVCGCVLLGLRQVRGAMMVLAIAITLAASIIGYTGWQTQAAQAATPGFRFVTFNRYFANDDFAAVGNWVQQSKADVVALQEVDSMQTVQKLAAVLPSYPHVYAQLNAEADVAIFSRWPILSGETVELSPRGSQIARTVIDWDGKKITLIGAHLHWPMGAENSRLRDAELQVLAVIAKATPGPLLIGGDFNITPWSALFQDAIARSGMTDCARGHGLVTTWPSWFPPAGIRIDHCLASDHWRVTNLSVGPALGSDHRAVVNDLELLQEKPANYSVSRLMM